MADCTGLENRCHSAASHVTTSFSTKLSADSNENATGVLASCLALLAKKSTDLALVVERWDTLPEAIRAGIVAMVNAAGK